MTTITTTLHYPPADMPPDDVDILIWRHGERLATLGAWARPKGGGELAWHDTHGEELSGVTAWSYMPALPVEADVIALRGGGSVDLREGWRVPA